MADSNPQIRMDLSGNPCPDVGVHDCVYSDNIGHVMYVYCSLHVYMCMMQLSCKKQEWINPLLLARIIIIIIVSDS